MKNGLSLPFLTERAARAKLKRWDVAVFKLPEEPEVRYIKRLVGMPNEVIRIQGGDLWGKGARQPGRFRAPPTDARPPTGHAVDGLRRRTPSRRVARRSSAGCDGRATGASACPARSRPPNDQPTGSELRYHHLVPSPGQWEAIRAGTPPSLPRPTLITDYCSYNTDLTAEDHDHPYRDVHELGSSLTGSGT